MALHVDQLTFDPAAHAGLNRGFTVRFLNDSDFGLGKVQRVQFSHVRCDAIVQVRQPLPKGDGLQIGNFAKLWIKPFANDPANVQHNWLDFLHHPRRQLL